jgi:hypothetical protein
MNAQLTAQACCGAFDWGAFLDLLPKESLFMDLRQALRPSEGPADHRFADQVPVLMRRRR